MKKKEKDELCSLSKSELEKKIRELEAKCVAGSVEAHTKQPKNTRITKLLRKQIAVAKTILREKELG